MKDGLLEHGEILSYWDIILGPIYLMILFFIVYKYIQRYEQLEIQKYCLPAFSLKIFSAIVTALLYHYYFISIDAKGYFYGSMLVYDTFFKDPSIGFELLTTPLSQFSDAAKALYNQFPSGQFGCSACRQVIKIGTLLSFFTFNTYIPIALILALISFLGSWKLFQVFYDLYPRQHLLIAVAILFLPSIVFWGSSGLTKDTIVMPCVSFLVWSSYNIFIKKRFELFLFLILIVCTYFLVTIKIYIAIILIPSLIGWIAIYYFLSIKKVGPKLILALGTILVSISSIQLVGYHNQSFSFKHILSTAIHVQQFNKRITALDNSETVFRIGDLNKSAKSFLMIPKAINVTLFRPYPWEVSKKTIIPFIFESLFFIFFTIYVIYKVRFKTLLRVMSKDPHFYFCLFYALLFAIGIGVTTYNFGTLTRYKIPCISFYLLALIILLNEEFTLRQVRKGPGM